jgi:hypothetical protein
MGACSSKPEAEELNFSSLEQAGDGKAKTATTHAALPPSSLQYAVSGSGGAVVPLQAVKALNPLDFQLSRRTSELLVKYPGDINGQSFLIEECNDCDIFLLDHSAAVTIDVCHNCRVTHTTPHRSTPRLHTHPTPHHLTHPTQRRRHARPPSSLQSRLLSRPSLRCAVVVVAGVCGSV